MNKDGNREKFSKAGEQARPFIYVISGTLSEVDDGERRVPFWALVEIPAEKLNNFLNAYNLLKASRAPLVGELELHDYVSKVIEMTVDEVGPSQEKWKELQSTYGDNLNFLSAEEPGACAVVPGSPTREL